MRSKIVAGEYLAFLSIKHEVDPEEFFYALISAEENQKCRCGNLTIECRGRAQDKVMFLILKDFKVVAQFPVPNEFLLERDNPIKRYMKTDMICRHLKRKNKKSQSLLIGDLRTGMSQINLKAKVLEIPLAKQVLTRFGSYAKVTNALIADETGTIRLCLWNEQINSVSRGDTIQLENARTSTFRGEKQLCIGKNGTLSNVKNIGSQIRSA